MKYVIDYIAGFFVFLYRLATYPAFVAYKNRLRARIKRLNDRWFAYPMLAFVDLEMDRHYWDGGYPAVEEAYHAAVETLRNSFVTEMKEIVASRRGA